jgi:hypothetical protein
MNQAVTRRRKIRFVIAGLLTVAVAVPFGLPSGAAPGDPAHLRVTTANAGWGRLKIGYDANNLWAAPRSPAAGATTISLVLRDFGGNANWSKLAVAPGAAPGVAIGNYLPAIRAGWFTVDMPLSAWPAGSFTNISNISAPASQDAGAIDIGIARISFTGGASDVWFTGDSSKEATWPVSAVPADNGGGTTTTAGSGTTTTAPGNTTTTFVAAGSVCRFITVATANGGWNHAKIGNNANSIWNPAVSAGNNTAVRIQLRDNSGNANWSKLKVALQGDTARTATIADYLPANRTGWFTIDVPLSAFAAGAATSITNISVPWSADAGAFNISVGAISLVGGSAVTWTLGSGNAVETPWTFSETNVCNGTGTTTTTAGTTTTTAATTTTTAAGGTTTTAPTNTGGRGPRFGEFAGTNILPDTPPQAVGPFEAVRLYLTKDMIGQYAANGRDLAFNPADGWVGNLDAKLQAFSAGGTRKVMITLKDNFRYMNANPTAMPLLGSGANSNDPAAWSGYYDACYQIAARYGTAKPTGVQVRASNQALTGLGYVSQIEVDNEVWQWWINGAYDRTYNKPGGGTETRKSTDWSPEEEVAALTACNRGAKAADPNMRVSSAGTPGWDRFQLTRSDAHVDRVSGGVYPADDFVINSYWNNVSSNFDSTYIAALDYQKSGQSPDANGGREAWSKRVVSQVKGAFPTAKVVIGEFGYDTGAASWQEAPGTAKTSPENMQADWLIRDYLHMFGGGFDRAYQFMINGDGPNLFDGSGLFTSGYGARPSFYRVGGAISILRDARFVQDVNSGNPNVRIMELAADNGRRYYALWAPSANDTVVNGYQLAVQAGGAVTLQKPSSGEFGGYNVSPIITPVTRNGNGTVTVNVSESPVFVVVTP